MKTSILSNKYFNMNLFIVSDDGWWTGRDKDGNKGIVPSTLVKVYFVIIILLFK